MTRPDQPIALNLARIVHRLMVEPRGWRIDLLKSELGIADRTYRKYRGLLQDHFEVLLAPGGQWTIDEVSDGEARYLRVRGQGNAVEERSGFLGRAAGYWLARKLFAFSGDSELRDAVEGNWAEFVAGIKDKPFYLAHLLRHADRMLHFVADAPKDYTHHESTISNLLRALFYGRKIQVDYRPYPEQDSKSFLLLPLTLVLWRGGLYLVASFNEEGRPYLFALERLEHVELTPSRFRYPSEARYHPEEYFSGSFGIFQSEGQEAQDIELRFAAKPWLHRYIKERTWHPSQVVSTDPQGHLLLQMSVEGFEELLPWIRSFGTDVEVLGPKELIELLESTT